jgi:hypothetical protein
MIDILNSIFNIPKYIRWKKHLQKSGELRRRADCAHCTWTVFDNKLYLITLCKYHEENQWWKYSPGLSDLDSDVVILKRV